MDRETYINDNLNKHFTEAKSVCEECGDDILGIMLQGSQNYHLDIYSPEYTSDIDCKVIVLPSFDSFCKNKQPVSTTDVLDNNEHNDRKDLRLMFEMFKKQNVNFTEIMFTDYYILNSDYTSDWLAVKDLAERLVHAHPAQALKTMVGQSLEKRKALTHPYPACIDKINKYGYDGKQLHHIIRINDFMKKYLAGMSFKECLDARTGANYELSIDAKLNDIPLEVAIELADTFNEETRTLKDTYIERYGDKIVDTEAYDQLDEIKVNILKKHFKKQLED